MNEFADLFDNANVRARRFTGFVQARAFLIIIIVGMLTTFSWWLNINGHMAWNLIPLFAGFIWIALSGPNLTSIGIAAITFGAYRGATLNNPFNGAAEGASFWLTRFIPAALLTYCAAQGFLATWSFQGDPVSFWYMLAFGLIAMLAVVTYRKGGEVMYWIILLYSVVMMLISAINPHYPVKDKIAETFQSGFSASLTSTTRLPCGGDENFTGLPPQASGCSLETVVSGQDFLVITPRNLASTHCPRWTRNSELVVTPVTASSPTKLRTVAGAKQVKLFFLPTGNYEEYGLGICAPKKKF